MPVPKLNLAPITHWVGDRAAQWQRRRPLSHTVMGWFKVDEAEVGKILEQVRQSLPTTEAILVGKPQTGKSSIVRGLTGVSGDIVGQGYRPHTQNTQRYNFPTDALPLLSFTDTVGLGDGRQPTSEVVQELIGEWHPATERTKPTTSAKVIILTVKVTDFATATLRDIAAQIRAAQPNVPCILAITCLHESYPADRDNHPTYPPDFAAIQRAATQIQADFKGLYDRCVLLDFTLEEDGFDPVFYGLDALLDGLSDLLPHAESQAIAQLLDKRFAGDPQVVDQLGNLYRDPGGGAVALCHDACVDGGTDYDGRFAGSALRPEDQTRPGRSLGQRDRGGIPRPTDWPRTGEIHPRLWQRRRGLLGHGLYLGVG
jgi:predicted GTPase